MISPIEIIQQLVDKTSGDLGNCIADDIDAVIQAFESYGKLVQEEQIKLCAEAADLKYDEEASLRNNMYVDVIDSDSILNCPRVIQ